MNKKYGVEFLSFLLENKNLTEEQTLQIKEQIRKEKVSADFDRIRGQKQFAERDIKRYTIILITILITLFILLLLGKNPTDIAEAGYTNSASICNSDKCKTRFKYIEEAKSKHKSKEAIVEYTLIRTVFNKKKPVKVSEYREIKKEIENLYELTETKKDGLDLDRLAKAVAIAETSNCTKGYGVTHNNCHGIKHGNTVPCPGVKKGAMCKFKSTEESFEAFKIIWAKWYKEYPTYELASRWTGKDRTNNWLKIVNYNY